MHAARLATGSWHRSGGERVSLATNICRRQLFNPRGLRGIRSLGPPQWCGRRGPAGSSGGRCPLYQGAGSGTRRGHVPSVGV